ncbi:hypothetical protein BDA96_01G221400 [Sorghum bicolor]|uniref:Embryo surrounding factor 1 brassicaceae domain-containing protein n=2 Tax=Sorghum bicolor TaxID=4558 RepID=A0A1B6QK09_SORBI|nr:hypothetical protein BDA96_01G221400 [Sorghum bicolor]KAG0549051.1 hypothetical protein BDA96_01G221400 [Sorghum bicolor]KXG38262.1 hypothetical protein SORBI_3001G207900 [Sorghum bicolor]OQU91578.1 hypothetical protein SORBI_3001G207900 [Sorghum bicolor]
MRSSDEGLVHAMPILLIVIFGRLTLPGCPELLKAGDATSYKNSLISMDTSSSAVIVQNTSVGEKKLTIEFCVRYDCDEDHHPCYCCDNGDQKCHSTRKECQANCPACNPHCPPQQLNQTMMIGRSSRTLTNSTLVRGA